MNQGSQGGNHEVDPVHWLSHKVAEHLQRWLTTLCKPLFAKLHQGSLLLMKFKSDFFEVSNFSFVTFILRFCVSVERSQVCEVYIFSLKLEVYYFFTETACKWHIKVSWVHTGTLTISRAKIHTEVLSRRRFLVDTFQINKLKWHILHRNWRLG